MSIIGRRAATLSVPLHVLLASVAALPASAASKSIGQKWIDGWNATTADNLVAAFTPDGVYEDVPFGLKKKGSAELRDLHKYFHDAVGGLYVKLIAAHVSDGHGTIEWFFGGKDIGVFKTGRPFEVQGVSVILVRNGLISRNLDYYDAAAIMKQVGVLPGA
jgi:ketosteroid isomerase-like protein